MLHDIFICHASEDKDQLVRPLAEALRSERVEVWYDEFTLSPGDSLRRAIDKGLASSRLGVVILSRHFFAKSWPQWELDGLVQRELAAQDPVIIPIWHGIGLAEVVAYSPPLAGKVAISSNIGIAGVVRELLKAVHPQGSTLLVARDLVLDFGGKPPVVTDDWWLDAVEASAANPVESTFQEHSGWGWWGFPLPPRGNSPEERGQRLGWAAMQMMWMQVARDHKTCQVTQPEVVLDFISSQPGLETVCDAWPEFLAAYAPQLVIPGFSGPFTSQFDEALKRSTTTPSRGLRKPHLDIHPEWIALRHPEVESFDVASLACDFVSGYGISFGPCAKAFPIIDYVAWFLSSASGWLPELHRRLLTSGLKEWAAWPWDGAERAASPEQSFSGNDATGTLQRQLLDWVSESRPSRSGLRLSGDSQRDLRSRLAHSADMLGLPEPPQELADRFLRSGFIEEWFEQERARRKIGKTSPRNPSPGASRRRHI